MNINPEQAAREYRERTVAPYRSTMPAHEIKALEERLSGACTVEVAAFDEFALLLSDDRRTQEFDHVIFDTAPTGHTLRLLELPAAWTGFLETAPGDVSCLGPLSGLKTRHDRYARTVGALADPKATVIVLVARPERVALIEATRTSLELRGQSMTNQLLVINGVFRASNHSDALGAAFERRGAEALSRIPEEIASLPRAEIALRGGNIVGLDALKSMFTPQQTAVGSAAPSVLPQDISSLAGLVDELGRSDHGLVMVMGKGGVGKTTVAAAVALSLAKRGRAVHLTTTDPAQHIRETLQSQLSGLRVSYIDPKQEARQYRERMLETARGTLSADKLALLQEELKSPCYEEVAVFQAFSRIVIGARKELVIVDTAPTGHTLLLLDTAGAYHRQVKQQEAAGPVRVRTPLMMLQDPDYTMILIVTLPETTPVLEASALQDDLRRAKIEPFAWVVNGSLAAAQPRDPVLRARAAAEIGQIRKVKELATRVALIPFQAEEPVGIDRLAALSVRCHL
jgi:arsenite-transporting ATPase